VTTAKTIRRRLANLGIAILLELYSEAVVDVPASGSGALNPFPREQVLLYSYERLLLLSLYNLVKVKRCRLGKTRPSAIALRKKLGRTRSRMEAMCGNSVSISQNRKE